MSKRNSSATEKVSSAYEETALVKKLNQTDKLSESTSSRKTNC